MERTVGIADIGKELWRDGKGWIFIFLALGWILTFGARQIFPVFFTTFRDEFHLSLATLGVLYALVWIAYAFGQFPGGLLADRYGERSVLIWSSLLTAGTIGLIGLATTVPVLAGSMIVFGVVTAAFGPTRFTVLTDIYDRYDGTAVGIIQASGQIGNTVLPIIAGIIATYMSWRMGFFYLLPLLAITAIGLRWSMPARTGRASTQQRSGSTRDIRSTITSVITVRTVKFTAILGVGLFVMQGLAGFYPTYLTDEKGLTVSMAAILYGLLFFCAVVIQPTFGTIGALIEPRKILLYAIGVTIVGLLWLPFASSMIHLVVITICLGHYFAISPVIIPPLTNSLPAGAKGTGLGFLRTIYFFIGATGSIVVGWFADIGRFDESFYLLAIAMGVVGVLVATSAVHRGQ